MFSLIPSRKQWDRWSLPNKLGCISAYLGAAAFVWTIVASFWPTTPQSQHLLTGNITATSYGSNSPSIGMVQGDLVVNSSPSASVILDDVLPEIERRKKAGDADAILTRTFSLLARRGTTLTLGPYPEAKGMIFELGELFMDEGTLVQKIILKGEGFVVKRRSEGTSKYLLEMNTTIRAKGAGLDMPIGDGNMTIDFGLHKDAVFELFTPYADLRFTVLDMQVDNLKLKLEIRPPSGFTL